MEVKTSLAQDGSNCNYKCSTYSLPVILSQLFKRTFNIFMYIHGFQKCNEKYMHVDVLGTSENTRRFSTALLEDFRKLLVLFRQLTMPGRPPYGARTSVAVEIRRFKLKKIVRCMETTSGRRKVPGRYHFTPNDPSNRSTGAVTF